MLLMVHLRRRSITTRLSLTSRPVAKFRGRPSLGAWLSYGLGSMNEDLPDYVVMHAKSACRSKVYLIDFGEPDSCRPTIGEFCLEVKKMLFCI